MTTAIHRFERDSQETEEEDEELNNNVEIFTQRITIGASR